MKRPILVFLSFVLLSVISSFSVAAPLLSSVDGKDGKHFIITTTPSDLDLATQALKVTWDNNDPKAITQVEIIEKSSKEYSDTVGRENLNFPQSTEEANTAILTPKLRKATSIGINFVKDQQDGLILNYEFNATIVIPVVWLHLEYDKIESTDFTGYTYYWAENIKASLSIYPIRVAMEKPSNKYSASIQLVEIGKEKVRSETAGKYSIFTTEDFDISLNFGKL